MGVEPRANGSSLNYPMLNAFWAITARSFSDSRTDNGLDLFLSFFCVSGLRQLSDILGFQPT